MTLDSSHPAEMHSVQPEGSDRVSACSAKDLNQSGRCCRCSPSEHVKARRQWVFRVLLAEHAQCRSSCSPVSNCLNTKCQHPHIRRGMDQECTARGSSLRTSSASCSWNVTRRSPVWPSGHVLMLWHCLGQVQLMGCKAITGLDGHVVTSAEVKCIEYALRMGAHITSNSWGGM